MGHLIRCSLCALVGLGLAVAACAGGEASADGEPAGAGDGNQPVGAGGGQNAASGGGGGTASRGSANEYSWDGSWNPPGESFPLEGLLDETHAELPPGKWGWDGACDCPGDEGTAIYDNEFVDKGLDFERLEGSRGGLFGWRLIDTDGGSMSLNHRGDHYDGTPGVDLFDLRGDGKLQGTGPDQEGVGGINLGDGPDMLRYGVGWSVDLRVGDARRGHEQDNDLVLVGSEQRLGTGEYDVYGTTIHTGPGSDLVFARNFGPAAIDLGNGEGGRTDSIDADDGPDMLVLEGNARDFRVFGGNGDDVFVWYVDEVDEDTWLGPSFYGGGGWGEALWGDPGRDRLVLVVDPATEVVSGRSSHDDNPGSFMNLVYDPYEPSIDGPTENDAFARYRTPPIGPRDEHMTTVSYRSADGAVFTHDFYIISVEEVQLGLGEDARVYDVDPVTGVMTPSSAPPLVEVPDRSYYNELFETFGRS